jgi:hypothetical protein
MDGKVKLNKKRMITPEKGRGDSSLAWFVV